MPKKSESERDVLDDLKDIEDAEELEDEPEAEPEAEEEPKAPKKEEKKAPAKAEPKKESKPEPEKEERRQTASAGWGFILGIALLVGAIGGFILYRRRTKGNMADGQPESDQPLE